jgi:hypothetical protein
MKLIGWLACAGVVAVALAAPARASAETRFGGSAYARGGVLSYLVPPRTA